MTKPYHYGGDTYDGKDHEHDSYTAAGAAPGASFPCSGFRLSVGSGLASGPVQSGFRSGPVQLPVRSSLNRSGWAGGDDDGRLWREV